MTEREHDYYRVRFRFRVPRGVGRHEALARAIGVLLAAFAELRHHGADPRMRIEEDDGED